MEFDFTEDQRTIRDTAVEVLAARSPWPAVRQHAEAGTQDTALLGELTELGWTGIAVGEAHGGQGLGLVELVILLEAVGRACAALPFAGSVLAAQALEHGGNDEQRDRWLPGLADGSRRGAVGRLVDGAAELVVDGEDVAVFVLFDGHDAIVVPAEDADVTPIESIDPTRRACRIEVAAGAGEPLAGDARAAVDRVTVGLAAGAVGTCQRALEMTVEYVKERKQFGVPVGSFQAVSHRAAQMLFDVEAARSATLYAAWCADASPEDLPLAAAMAATSASVAARAVTPTAVQLHGGIGFTWEADVHWLYKRAQVDAAQLGLPSDLRRQVTGLQVERLADTLATA